MSDALDWNAATIAEFRANEGRVGGNFAGAPMVLVHHRGRKSGREYVTPTMYLPHDTEPDVIYIFATKAGAPTNPDWYHNFPKRRRDGHGQPVAAARAGTDDARLSASIRPAIYRPRRWDARSLGARGGSR